MKNAREFKAQAMRVADRINIDFCTKKEILDSWLRFTDGELDALRCNDDHVYVYVGTQLYSDEEITPSILRHADYIEYSYSEGYMFYLGRNVDENCLEDAFDASVGWHIEAMEEWGELEDIA